MFWRRRTRREPVLDTIGSLFHLRLTPGDRAGGPPESKPRSAEGEASPKGGKRKRGRRKRRRLRLRFDARRLAYWMFVLVDLGRALTRCALYRRLAPSAAAAVAGRAATAAVGHDPRRRWQGLRDARRNGRRVDSAQGAPALPSAGLHRDRGSALSLAFRRRSARTRTRGGRQPVVHVDSRGRLDADAAARQESLSHREAHDHAQARRARAGPLARGALHEGRDPRALPQPRLFRRRRLRR